jgi:hypothetical protein
MTRANWGSNIIFGPVDLHSVGFRRMVLAFMLFLCYSLSLIPLRSLFQFCYVLNDSPRAFIDILFPLRSIASMH